MAASSNLGSGSHLLQGQDVPSCSKAARVPHRRRTCVAPPRSLRHSLLDATCKDFGSRFLKTVVASKCCSLQKGSWGVLVFERPGVANRQSICHRNHQVKPCRTRAIVANPAELDCSKQNVQTRRHVPSLFQRWQRWWRVPYVERKEKERVAQQQLSRSPLSLARKLWVVMQPPAFLLIGAIVFMVLAAAAELAIPHFVSAAIFSASSRGSRAAFHNNLRILGGLAVGYGTFCGLRGFLFSMLNLILTQNLRTELFSRLLKQPIEFFDANEAGQLTSRLGTDCQTVSRCLATNFNVAARNSLQYVGGLVYLSYMNPQLAAATGGVSIVLCYFAGWYGKFARKMQRSYQDALADTNQVADQAFSLARIVRSFGTEEIELERYKRNLQCLWDISYRKSVAYLAYLIVNASLFNCTKVMALLLGGALIVTGMITDKQLTSYVLYVEFVTSASLSVCDQWANIMESVGASDRVMEFLDKPIAPQLSPGVKLQNFEGNVTVQDVWFTYPTRPNIYALQGVTLSFMPGELVALVGLSGSGKSTLVSLIERHYDPSLGKIYVDGVDLKDLDPAWYRDQLGIVSQDPRLFSDTVFNNIAYGVTADRSAVEDAARKANAHDFIMALPLGYETPVTDKLLSGGQRQRLALARALVRDAKILILDEATSALDAESEKQVQDALNKAMQDTSKTVIVIAHRLSTVKEASRIVVMEKGEIVEQGDHAALLQRDGIYAKLVKRQSLGLNPEDQDMAPHQEPAGIGEGTAKTSGECEDEKVPDELITSSSDASANVMGLNGRPACGGPASAGAIAEQAS